MTKTRWIVVGAMLVQLAFSGGQVAAQEREQDLGKVIGLNNRAWAVFERSNDRDSLEAALASLKPLVEPEGKGISTAVIDTYANLLYKLGRVDEAMTWQEKAVAAEPDSATREMHRTTLEKMKKGEPTWPEP